MSKYSTAAISEQHGPVMAPVCRPSALCGAISLKGELALSKVSLFGFFFFVPGHQGKTRDLVLSLCDRELVSGPAILNAVKRRYCVGPSAGSIFTATGKLNCTAKCIQMKRKTKFQTSDVKPISSSAHFLPSTRWRSPEAISCSEDGEAQLSARPSGLFLWSCAAGNNNGMFCAAEANKEGTEAGAQQVL